MTATGTDRYTIKEKKLDEELAEVLTAISVIARQLSMKITAKQKSKEAKDVHLLRADGKDRHSRT
jgi:NTP pyrophosphatase (non-canonical NTP hydrolase)